MEERKEPSPFSSPAFIAFIAPLSKFMPTTQAYHNRAAKEKKESGVVTRLHLCRGGSRGRVQGVRIPPPTLLR